SRPSPPPARRGAPRRAVCDPFAAVVPFLRMPDALASFEGGLAICVASEVAREAGRRHRLQRGSEAALGQALTGALLVAAAQSQRVDVQLECAGPLRGLLVDA